MKSHYSYYGVAGMKGYAVYDSYQKAAQNRVSFLRDNMKGFNNFKEAKAWCEEYYYKNNYAAESFMDYDIIEEIKKVNKKYVKKWGYAMVGIKVVNRHRCPCKDIRKIVKI